MLDIVNDETTQANARTLNDLFAGKQVVNSRDLDLPARSVAFTDGTHVTIQAATALPNGTRLNANGLAMDSDNFTNDDDDYYNGKYDSGRIVRARVETTSEFTDTNGMSAPQVERTITLWALAENNMRPEKIAEVSGEYAAHSDLRPTLIIKYGDTRISAADAALEPQW